MEGGGGGRGGGAAISLIVCFQDCEYNDLHVAF